DPTDLQTSLRFGRIDLAERFWGDAAVNWNDCAEQVWFVLYENAVASCEIQPVLFLRQRGAPLDCKGEFGETLLHVAVKTGCLEILRYLITAGLDITATDHDWKTPLLWAIENLQHACAAELMKCGARTDTCDRRGNTALHVACFVGDPDMTRLICKHTMDLNSLNTDGCSPLHVAAKHGFLKTVRELLLAGANPEVRSKKGITADVMAFAQGHRRVGMLLTKMKPARYKHWRDQLLDRNQHLPRIKLKLLGSTMVGKSQLANSIKTGFLSGFVRKKLTTVSELTGWTNEPGSSNIRQQTLPYEWNMDPQHEHYTRGIEVHSTSEFSIWDFSGYEPYYFIYDHFIGDVNCIHMVLFNLMDSVAWRRANVLFWLDFLCARTPNSEPYLVGGKSIKPVHVVLVATHADYSLCPKNDAGIYVDEGATRLLHEVRKLYAYKLDICDTVYCLDARDATSAELKHLKCYLTDTRASIIQTLPLISTLLTDVTHALNGWCADRIIPMDSLEKFSDRVRKDVNPLCTEDHLNTLIEHLQYTGSIVYTESPSADDMIILNPNWLLNDILGECFSHEMFRRSRVTGSFTVDDFQLFVRAQNTEKLIVLMEALGICVCCVVHEQPTHEVRSRCKKSQSCGKPDFFQQASQSHPTTQRLPAKSVVSAYVARDIISMGDEVRREDIQIEIPRLNLLPMELPEWSKVITDQELRYSGYLVSSSPGAMLHLMPRIQLQLRYSTIDLLHETKWVGEGAERLRDISTRWDLSQWLHGSKLVILKGAVEVLINMHQDNTSLILLARCLVKHARRTFGLLHNIIYLICQHLDSICPGLELRVDLLSDPHSARDLTRLTTWDSAELTDSVWRLFLRETSHLAKRDSTSSQKRSPLEPNDEDLLRFQIHSDEQWDVPEQLLDDLCLGDSHLVSQLIRKHCSSLGDLRHAVIREIANHLESEGYSEHQLQQFAAELGVTDPLNKSIMTQSGTKQLSSTAVLLGAQYNSTFTVEQLIKALCRLGRKDLVQYLYRTHFFLTIAHTTSMI
ncbi:Death-associated protein kinase 1, partial [Clonorchis sinensis]